MVVSNFSHLQECWECGKQWADNLPLSKMCIYCASRDVHVVCNVIDQAHLMTYESTEMDSII